MTVDIVRLRNFSLGKNRCIVVYVFMSQRETPTSNQCYGVVRDVELVLSCPIFVSWSLLYKYCVYVLNPLSLSALKMA